MYLEINKCVTAVKVSNFSGHYLRNSSTLDIGVLGYIGIVQHKEHSPEVLSIPPGTPCMYIQISILFIFNVMFMYSNCNVYVFLSLCMLYSVYYASLCRSVYCLCVNVYCTAATGCQPNYSQQIY